MKSNSKLISTLYCKYSKYDQMATTSKKSIAIEPLEDRILMAVFTVINNSDTGAGSLRWAIEQSNNTAGVDTIAFNISSASKTIYSSSELALWDPAILDATTQPGYAGRPLVQVDGAGAPWNADGIKLGGGSVLKGLSITHFKQHGVACAVLGGAGGNVVQKNWIGLDLNGNAAGNGLHGVGIYTPYNLIGGPTRADGNVISGNTGKGIWIMGGLFGNNASGNTIQNNLIGTSIDGLRAIGNHDGIGIQGSPANNILNNVISGSDETTPNNGGDGILLYTTASSNQNIQGNFIGTDITGTIALSNEQYGIEVQSANNTIKRNVISGNHKAGIVFWKAAANGNTVQGNMIGVDASGTRALGNHQQGLAFADGAGANLIGGPNAGDGNVIGSNLLEGLGIFPGYGEVIQGNRIGIGLNGERLGNGGYGIAQYSGGNIQIGGSSASMGNIIAFNSNAGITAADVNANRGNNIMFNNAGENIATIPTLPANTIAALIGTTTPITPVTPVTPVIPTVPVTPTQPTQPLKSRKHKVKKTPKKKAAHKAVR